jgi:hypothetical protein
MNFFINRSIGVVILDPILDVPATTMPVYELAFCVRSSNVDGTRASLHHRYHLLASSTEH